jgi:C4-dicarboxylate-specific signal transduction histidine kinase
MKAGIKLNDKPTILTFIRSVIEESEELKNHLVHFEGDEVLFRQGETLTYLYLLLEGSVILNHTREDGSSLDLVHLDPGNFVGLVAFSTGNPSLTTCRVKDEIKALRIAQDEFEQYMNDHPRLRHPLQQLMMNNMTDRFMQNVQLESKMNALNLKLEEEGEQLREAYRKLEDSQQKIIHQEKMATLGELVAGFAHEVNNPAAALIRSSEMLREIFVDGDHDEILQHMFLMGLQSAPVSSEDTRKRMQDMTREFSEIRDRSILRKLAQMPEEALEHIRKYREEQSLERLLRRFEAGRLIHNIEIASSRIANLVKSLKSYSRQDHREDGMIDIREGIRDTVQILSNRLKYMDVNIELDDIPETCGRMGELNQVWTNILVNACDVLENGGHIDIICKKEGRKIMVEISDNGPGIPEEILDRIFEPNFTTKNQGARFGLGLGLAISSEIVQQHGGSLKASNNDSGGARFTILLPVRKC